MIPYPPGVCLIGPGEEVSQEVIDYIEKARNIKIDIDVYKRQVLDWQDFQRLCRQRKMDAM